MRNARSLPNNARLAHCGPHSGTSRALRRTRTRHTKHDAKQTRTPRCHRAAPKKSPAALAPRGVGPARRWPDRRGAGPTRLWSRVVVAPPRDSDPARDRTNAALVRGSGPARLWSHAALAPRGAGPARRWSRAAAVTRGGGHARRWSRAAVVPRGGGHARRWSRAAVVTRGGGPAAAEATRGADHTRGSDPARSRSNANLAPARTSRGATPARKLWPRALAPRTPRARWPAAPVIPRLPRSGPALALRPTCGRAPLAPRLPTFPRSAHAPLCFPKTESSCLQHKHAQTSAKPTPTVGLEPTTTRLRALRSAD